MVLVLSFSCFSPSFTYSLPHSTCSLPGTPSSMSTPPRVKTAAPPHKEPMAIHHPLTGYEPNLLDNFDYSETSAMIFQDESGDIDTEPSYSCDAELDDETIGKALSSPLFIQEREEPANRRQAYHSHEESLLPAQSFFAHTSTARPVCELSSSQKRRSGRDMENERIRKDKKRKFSLKSEPRSRSTNFKPVVIEEVFRNSMVLLSLSEERLIMLLQVMNNSDEINCFFKNNCQNKKSGSS